MSDQSPIKENLLSGLYKRCRFGAVKDEAVKIFEELNKLRVIIESLEKTEKELKGKFHYFLKWYSKGRRYKAELFGGISTIIGGGLGIYFFIQTAGDKPTLEKYLPYINFFIFLLVIYAIHVQILEYRAKKDLYLDSPKEFSEKLKNLGLLFEQYFQAYLHQDVKGNASLDLVNYMLFEDISRGDDIYNIAYKIRELLAANVDQIRSDCGSKKTNEISQPSSEQQHQLYFPIISFESSQQRQILLMEEQVTNVLAAYFTGVPNVILPQAPQRCESGLFLTPKVEIFLPKNDPAADIAYEDLINLANDNFKKILYAHKQNNGNGDPKNSVGKLAYHLVETEQFLPGTRLKVTYASAGIEFNRIARYMRFCFWPKDWLLRSEIQGYIEIQELSGIPTFWIERTEESRYIFSQTWKEFEETCRNKGLIYEFFGDLYDTPDSNLEMYDFFVGPRGGYRGYINGKEIKTDQAQFFRINLAKKLVTQLINNGTQVFWAKDAVWLEFSENLFQHKNQQLIRKDDSLMVQELKDSGIIFRPMV